MNNIFGFLKTNNTDTKDLNSTKEKDDKVLIVRTNRCPQNHTCPAVKICPVNALKQKNYSAPTVDMDKCIKCGKCIKFCPTRALILQ